MCAWFRENFEIFLKWKEKNTGHIFQEENHSSLINPLPFSLESSLIVNSCNFAGVLIGTFSKGEK